MKYLILGAGPAGLSFANRLLQNGEQDFIVLEKEKEAGGLCRSVDVEGKPLDIGGGHFIDANNLKVLDFLFDVMPEEEWNLFARNSQISLYGRAINSPIEANIWQLPIEEQVLYLKSIAIAGCNLGTAMPEKFVDWIYWKLGRKIAEDYMIPYNQKMFGEDLNILGTYWLQKLPNVSFEETLLSCLEKRAYGKQPGHARFYYPKHYGSGEVWKRLAAKIKGHILYGIEINELDAQKRIVNNQFQADCIINTIPWMEFKQITGIGEEQKENIQELRYTSIAVEYVNEGLASDAHWIYCPEQSLAYHRILLRENFCPQSKGYWTETNLTRLEPTDRPYRYINKYAYPLNTIGKPEKIKSILRSFEACNIFGLGRWGEWEHYNSDVVVERAICLADKLMGVSDRGYK